MVQKKIALYTHIRAYIAGSIFCCTGYFHTLKYTYFQKHISELSVMYKSISVVVYNVRMVIAHRELYLWCILCTLPVSLLLHGIIMGNLLCTRRASGSATFSLVVDFPIPTLYTFVWLLYNFMCIYVHIVHFHLT